MVKKKSFRIKTKKYGRICNQKAQMKLSFGMIFSIILIIIFISFAFFAISKFLDLGNSAQVAKFANDLQKDIDKAWRGSQSSQVIEYFLPGKIQKVCFSDYSSGASATGDRIIYNELRKVFFEYENMFFYPIGSAEGLNAKEIKNINLETTTSISNPLCIDNANGKVKLTIKKSYGEDLVTITK